MMKRGVGSPPRCRWLIGRRAAGFGGGLQHREVDSTAVGGLANQLGAVAVAETLAKRARNVRRHRFGRVVQVIAQVFHAVRHIQLGVQDVGVPELVGDVAGRNGLAGIGFALLEIPAVFRFGQVRSFVIQFVATNHVVANQGQVESRT